jgi:hypothetical protein
MVPSQYVGEIEDISVEGDKPIRREGLDQREEPG